VPMNSRQRRAAVTHGGRTACLALCCPRDWTRVTGSRENSPGPACSVA
jgi:hypothetical protein